MTKRTKSQGKRPRQELVLFIVEGDSDRIALEDPINQYLDENDIDIKIKFCKLSRDRDGNEISGGDSTSDFGIHQKDFDRKISDRIMRDLTVLDGIYPKYIVEVIQIVDMDGAYITNDNIREVRGTEKPIYEEDCIKTHNIENIVKRNDKKRSMLDYLSNKKEIKLKTTTVDYSVYYFSCNIDHFLSDERNMQSNYKKSNAVDFQGKCLDDSGVFIKTFLEGDLVACDMSYEESWDYIKKGVNSLKRFSNINIMIDYLVQRYRMEEDC